MRIYFLSFLLFLSFPFLSYAHANDCENNNNRNHFNVLHYELNIAFDTANAHLEGVVKIKAEVLKNPKTAFQIDLQSPLQIQKIKYEGKTLKFSKKQNKYLVKVPNLIVGETFELEVAYSGIPKIAKNAPWDGGMIDTFDSKGKPWMAVACQDIGASVWFPCKDYKADEPELGVEMHYTIPNGLTAIGNGQFVSVNNNGDETNTWHWKVVSPINLYNITFYIGNYLRIQDTYESKKGALALEYWVLSENFQKAKEHFKVMPSILSSFEDWMGPYPFFKDGFKVVEAPYLGMEHQSAIAYGNNYQMGYAGRDRSQTGIGLLFDFILVHEIGHEWFGNNISIEDPAYFWIHEGFTSYTEVMYIESMFGKEKALDYLIGTRKLIANKAPLQSKLGLCHNENADNYPKGANLIQMIRQLMKDDNAFKNMIREMNVKFYQKVITGNDMETLIANTSGLKLDKVFDQYLRQVNLPLLKINQNADGFTYKWENCVKDFDMPVQVMIDGEEKWLYPQTKEQSHLQANIKNIALHKAFYCDFTLEH